MNKFIVRVGENVTLVVGASAILAIVAGAVGCSSMGGSSGNAATSLEMSFDVSQCQPQGPNLYKCPAIDKPICTPDFSQPDVQCIRIGRKGNLFVTTPGEND
ncbi:MAG: hypothetical protein ACLQAT_07310 [Candidatus Binataceae bacterium]